MFSEPTWLCQRGFNLLVDYYPEVQFRPYGSGATRQNVLPVLERLKPGYVCIYAEGHSGYTTWDSCLGTKHSMLAQDTPRLFRDVMREADIKLVLYYSGLLDGLAGTRHPEWVMRKADVAPSDDLERPYLAAAAKAIRVATGIQSD